MKPFIHSKAIVEEGALVGDGTRVWAFAHILTGSVIGRNCNICDHTFIEGAVVLGDNVTVKCGVYLWDGVVAEDNVFIGPAAAFTNDRLPRSNVHLGAYPRTLLMNGCSIGANATILPGITIGRWSMIGAGSVVTKSVPDHGIVWGNPAVLKYWICSCARKLEFGRSDTADCECGKMFKMGSDKLSITLCP